MIRNLLPKLFSTTLLVAAIAMLTGCKTGSIQRTDSGWRPLFAGSSKDGWEMVGPGELHLEDGALVSRGGMGLLWYTREKFGNCQIRVVFQLSKTNDNGGVFIRIPDRPADPWFAVHRGYEVQIDNTGGDWHRTGTLYSLTKARAVVNPEPGRWTTLLITLDGARTLVEIDGVLVTDHTEGDPVPPKSIWYEPERGRRPTSGYIGLQNHGDNDQVRYREVSVRNLPRSQPAAAECFRGPVW